MSRILETTYRGADISVEIAMPPAVTLKINRLVRDTAEAGTDPITLRVSSTVQTDYEWHEFIEGVVIFDRGAVTARIIANNQELVSRQFPDEETV